MLYEKAHVKQVLLTHIRKHMDEADHHHAMLSEARAIYSGQIEIAEGLQIIEI